MNDYLKTFLLLLFTVGFFPSLMAQKKLALANECFNAKAYYLASRYYQDFFDKKADNCHPDQIKLAQSLAATQQLAKAKSTFETYMNCQRQSPEDHIAFGKFLIDIKAYAQATPYFEYAMKAEPQLARHYLLVCQTALPKEQKSSSTVFIKQEIKPSKSIPVKENDAKIILVEKSTDPINIPSLTASTEMNQTNGIAADGIINSYESSMPEKKINSTTINQPIKTNLSPKITKTIDQPSSFSIVEKSFSPYGVRLGTYKPSRIPDLSSIEGYGRIEQRKWNGKIIFFLVDFSDRVAAEAMVKLAVQKNFRSATLVEKLSSGRMKSVR